MFFEQAASNSRRQGLIAAVPIVLGYLPVGFAYGALAVQAGLSPFNTVFMSLLVYAGASQFIAVSLLAASAPVLTILAATFMVNLRHLIMSSALAPRLAGWRGWETALFTFELTDETFAVHTSGAAGPPDKAAMFTINITAQSAWLLGSGLGAVAGGYIRGVDALALDYALPALFTALLTFQIKDFRHLAAAACAGFLAVGFVVAGWGHWAVILPTLAGAGLGLVLEAEEGQEA
jgi:4-azaleucine resistance transporter AzlC